MVLLGKRIKELRNKYKLTQSNLAERLGVTVSSIAAYENNSRQPSYEVLIKMADVFKVTIDSLLLDRSQDIVDVTGLSPEHIEQIQNIKENHPDILNNIKETMNILNENPNKK